MEPELRRSVANDTNVELRVDVSSKREVLQQLQRYKNILETVLDGQKDVEEETTRVLLQELLADFEAGVQDSVLVDGKPWEEAADGESSDLDVVLDDAIVEAAWKRRVYPRRVLPHAVRSLKAERKLLGLHAKAVNPEELVRDPGGEKIMSDVAAAAPQVVKEAVQVMKSIHSVQRQAEGLCDVLTTKPSPTTLEIHQEVLGHTGQSDAHLLPEGGTHRSRRPIRRAVEEAAAAGGYVPPAKKPVG
ncbi:unnamed protein product [Tetraodon nigroviridis]|uniref:(spotted green pufferfish) hypothetical protein n=1 Tax=Tetraodon nigroviridis TaxID=99883 RepID=Q4TC43_TETNG|nr:unnamed protein product [Tetraodon nigroviridis]